MTEKTPACEGMDTAIFFEATEHSPKGAARATSICGRCPLIKQCRNMARTYEAGKPITHRFGVWAGLTPAQRLLEDINYYEQPK